MNISTNFFDLSFHAEERLTQRSIGLSAVNLVLEYGKCRPAKGGCHAYSLSKTTTEELVSEGFDEEKVRSAAKIIVIASDRGQVITSYFPSNQKIKRLKKAN